MVKILKSSLLYFAITITITSHHEISVCVVPEGINKIINCVFSKMSKTFVFYLLFYYFEIKLQIL